MGNAQIDFSERGIPNSSVEKWVHCRLYNSKGIVSVYATSQLCVNVSYIS